MYEKKKARHERELDNRKSKIDRIKDNMEKCPKIIKRDSNRSYNNIPNLVKDTKETR